ncbi:MAG TPA: phosphopyruvate hydratase, partial [Chloroflexota bacterium]
MSSATIQRVAAREILDSRGRPTIEADVFLSDGTLGRASVPSGASTGTHEAVELRDGDPDHYAGSGVRRAVSNVLQVIGPAVRGVEAADQARLDALLVDLDGTPDRGRLGANALLSVSLATCRAAAVSASVPLYQHIASLAHVAQPAIPLPMVNIVSGGLHAGGQIEIQDVLAMPTGAQSFAQALEWAWRVHHAAGERVRREGHPPLVADEGGWAPPFTSNEQALEWVTDAIGAAGLRPGVDVCLAIDVAATHFFDAEGREYVLRREDRRLSGNQMVEMLATWRRAYPLVSIEDGLAEDDWEGWHALAQRLGDNTQVVGDDLFTTHATRVELGIHAGAANAVLVKVNQIGTLSEALRVVERVREVSWRSVVSARSGETEDAFLSDLAVGSGADQVKVGS